MHGMYAKDQALFGFHVCSIVDLIHGINTASAPRIHGLPPVGVIAIGTLQNIIVQCKGGWLKIEGKCYRGVKVILIVDPFLLVG